MPFFILISISGRISFLLCTSLGCISNPVKIKNTIPIEIKIATGSSPCFIIVYFLLITLISGLYFPAICSFISIEANDRIPNNS